MPQSHRAEPNVLDYAQRGDDHWIWVDVLLWLMPMWCALIIGAAYVGHHRDDPYWYAAMGLPAAAGLACAYRKRRVLSWYCLAVALGVTIVGVALPSFNHAT